MRAYILRINSPVSLEYAKITADSCDKIDLDWEYPAIQGEIGHGFKPEDKQPLVSFTII